MIPLTHQTRILLGVACADYRKGIDGFIALCEHELGQNPRSGVVFCFRNRTATMIRALHYDGTGYWLMTKRLSKGRFRHWPTGPESLSPAQASELRQLLLGGPWRANATSATASTTLYPSTAETEREG